MNLLVNCLLASCRLRLASRLLISLLSAPGPASCSLSTPRPTPASVPLSPALPAPVPAPPPTRGRRSWERPGYLWSGALFCCSSPLPRASSPLMYITLELCLVYASEHCLPGAPALLSTCRAFSIAGVADTQAICQCLSEDLDNIYQWFSVDPLANNSQWSFVGGPSKVQRPPVL